jgi:hypothetical protein
MSRSRVRFALVSGLALLALTVAREATAADGPGVRRIDLPSLSTVEDFPYTIEIPADWAVRREVPEPGIYLGPPSVDPKQYPEMLFVRWSRVDLTKPEATAANIKANDTKNDDWIASEVTVVDVGTVKGLWVLMQYPAKNDVPARTSLTLKVPIQGASIDIIGAAPATRFPELRAHFEKVLRSVRPAPPTPAP